MGQATQEAINFELEQELRTERERHRLQTLRIRRGWGVKELADAYGIAKHGVPYDSSMVSRALNGKAYLGLARDLEVFMTEHEGTKFDKNGSDDSPSQ